MHWDDVLENANRQEEKGKYLAKIQSRPISDFYGTLYGPSVNGNFVNQSGSNLLGDFLTAPHVVVDLYDESQQDFVKRYGIDLDLLLRLRDGGRATVCANLPPERYKKTAWLHDILADPNTIFRSVLTPQYFESQVPGFGESRNTFQEELEKKLKKRSRAEIDRLCELIEIVRPPRSEEELAQILSLWAKQVEAVAPDQGKEILHGILNRPEDTILSLRQWRLCTVSPISAGLGGTMRIPFETMGSYFPYDLSSDLVIDREFVRLQGLNEFLLDKRLSVAVTDITRQEYWSEMSDYDRKAIIESLMDKEKLSENMQVERNLRLEIAKSGGAEWTQHQIEEFVAGIERSIDAARTVIHIAYKGFWATAFVCAILGHSWVGLAGIGAQFVGNPIPRDLKRRFLEFCLPRLQIVNFVRRVKRNQ